MAKGFAINNSMTSHGGIIKATQQRTSQMGNLFLRADDGHYCPQCQCWSKIIKSHDHIIMDGKAVAYVDDLLTCGAKILPKQNHVVGDSQGSNYRSSALSSLRPLNIEQNFKNSLVEDKKEEVVCYCDRDLTLAEFLEIIKGMRNTERELKGTSSILNHPKCPVVGDKNHQALLNVFNSTMKKYSINTCIRKLHFLAQTYWESDRFRTTSEYASGDYLDPGKHAQAKANGNTEKGDGARYKGRGFMQLTWRKNYKRYFSFVINNSSQYEGIFPKDITLEQLLDRTKKYPEIVGSNLFLAMDSGGWFWNNGVVLRNGQAADINLQADIDDINKISLWVNGGGNGRSERLEYWNNLKKVMKYDQCKNKK